MKFLTDAMFGKLTRFLRILGYDTIYADELESYFHISPVPDDKLLEYAIKYDRIIITRDYPFCEKAKNRCIYLDGEGVYNYLKQLKDKLHLKYNFSFAHSRCSVCNSELKKVQTKVSVKNEVKGETYKTFDEFYRCVNKNCNKIFWRGSHIERILNKLIEKQLNFETKRKSED